MHIRIEKEQGHQQSTNLGRKIGERAPQVYTDDQPPHSVLPAPTHAGGSLLWFCVPGIFTSLLMSKA